MGESRKHYLTSEQVKETRDKVVMLRDKHGMEWPHIAERLGLSQKRVTLIYREAKKEMVG